MKKPAPLTDLLASIFAGKPVEKRLRELKVWQVWAEAVGTQIAMKAKPAGIRDGILIVRVASSPWMQQLSLMKPDIISQLNSLAGEPLVKEIIFKAGRVDLPPENGAAAVSRRTLSAEEEDWINERAAVIADPELRQTFCSLLSRHLTSSTGKT